MEEKRIWWTTGKRTYYATFAQFAAANKLDYDPNPSELAAALQLAMLEMIPLRKMLREKTMTPLI